MTNKQKLLSSTYLERNIKILFWDIETSLMKGYFFSLWHKMIPIEDVISDWRILCICYAWNNEEPKRIVGRERTILRKFIKILNQADIIVYHNGDKFDMKRVRAKAFEHGLLPPKPFNSANTVDTLKVAKKEFDFSSRKLDFIAHTILKIGQKLQTNKKLWIDATEGCKDALERMATYCEQDVILLRDVYLRMIPYITNHPNLSLFTDNPACPNCGSEDLQKNGVKKTRTGLYQEYKCKSCGSYPRGKKNLKTVEMR